MLIQGLFQVLSRDTPFHLERKGLVDLRYIITIRIEIIFGSSLFFPFFPFKLFKSFADQNQTSTLDARYTTLYVLHIQIMHIVLRKIKLIVAIECSLLPYNIILNAGGAPYM